MLAGKAKLSNVRALALLLSFGAFAAAQIAPARTDCAADGSVVNAITGEPVPRARVTALPTQLSTVADDAGRWSLSNLTCGRGQITAARPGFLTGGIRTPENAAAPALILQQGSPAHDLTIKLTPQAVVTGKVTDEQGDPVPGAQIIALSSIVIGGKRTVQSAQSVVTNDLGEYRLAGLKAGRLIFCAQTPMAPPGETTTAQDACFPAEPEGGAVSGMAVFAGAETHVDFVLREVHAVHVRGTVSGMPPSRGAALTLRYRGSLSQAYVARPAQVDPLGRFEIRGVPPGSYMLAVDYWDSGHRLMAHVPVDVGNVDVDGVAVRLEPGLTVTGKVRVESSSGAARLPAYWGMHLVPSEPNLSNGSVEWSRDGSTFTVTDVAPGNYSITGTPPAPLYLKRAMIGGRDFAWDVIAIAQPGLELDVVLGDDGGVIEGAVENAEGKPPSTGAGITVLQNGRLAGLSSSGADGHFRVPNLAPGDYRIYAWDNLSEAEYADEEWMRLHGGYGQNATVASGQTATVNLTVAAVGP